MTARPDLEARLRTMHDRLIECSGYIDVKACRYDCQTMHDLRAAAAVGAEAEREEHEKELDAAFNVAEQRRGRAKEAEAELSTARAELSRLQSALKASEDSAGEYLEDAKAARAEVERTSAASNFCAVRNSELVALVGELAEALDYKWKQGERPFDYAELIQRAREVGR